MISYNPCRIRILLFISYSFGTETTNTFIHTRSSLENHTLFQINRAKWTPAFRPIRCKNHTLWSGAYTYMGVSGGSRGGARVPPLIFRPNRGPTGQIKVVLRPPPVISGSELPSPLFSRSGFATGSIPGNYIAR